MFSAEEAQGLWVTKEKLLMKSLLGKTWLAGLCAAMLLGAAARPVGAAKDKVGPDPKEIQEVLDKAIAFLKQKQNDDGSFAPKLAGPGVTALVVAGLLRNGQGFDDPIVTKALGYMEKKVKKNGGIYDKALANYTTSVSLMAFREANKKGKYDTLIKNATKFLKKLQDSTDEKDLKFGGVGYDKEKRPDMSNTQFFIDALLAAGVSKDDPAIKNAIKFVSRCQNIKDENNDQPFAKKATKDDEGGFVYNPDPDDNPHKTSGGGLRSLGGMTYGGLKSFLYAGVSKKDPRVKAAIGWIKRHYTLENNPGMGKNGMFYFYHTFGKAMDALGEDIFEDAKGTKHDWRRELFAALKKRQKENGSWSRGQRDPFGEDNPELATAFAVLTLSYCKAPAK
jgi:squalene-hopene/tetraprenyl-beta-curcumene cyclase